jgi:hypothetical protein
MTKSKFKSDDRPSDTKSVVLNKEADARLLEHLKQLKGQTESQFWRATGYFYLDFMAWRSTQPGAPEPGQAFVYYQTWLEQRQAQPANVQATVDAESIAAAILPGVRDVFEAALSTALAGASVARAGAPPASQVMELADLFSTELVLE